MSDSFAQQKKKKEIEQCALELRTLSQMGQNKYCADCGHKPAKWVSVNIGCWLCIRCSGIHRSLGVHISFVKSATLDDWSRDLLNKFKALGGNEAVNSMYEAKLKIGGKICYETNEYVAIDFIKDKYVQKKWMKKQKNNVRNPRKKEHKPSQKSHSKHIKNKSNKIKVDHHKKPQQREPMAMGEPSQHEAYSINDNPKEWIKFTDNEGEQESLSMDSDSNNDMIPNLLDLDELQTFAFSDLATFDAGHPEDHHESFDALEMKQNEPRKLDKAAILSRYDNNPSSWMKFQSPSPRTVVPRNYKFNGYVNQNNYYNPYQGYNQFEALGIGNVNVNNYQQQYNANMNNYQQQRQQYPSNQIGQVPVNSDINVMGNGMDEAQPHDSKQIILSKYSEAAKSDNPFRDNDNNDGNNYNANQVMGGGFNPYSHIDNLCNNNSYYVYNSNVSY